MVESTSLYAESLTALLKSVLNSGGESQGLLPCLSRITK